MSHLGGLGSWGGTKREKNIIHLLPLLLKPLFSAKSLVQKFDEIYDTGSKIGLLYKNIWYLPKYSLCNLKHLPVFDA